MSPGFLLLLHKLFLIHALLFLMSTHIGTNTTTEGENFLKNKNIPATIYEEARKALSHYPDLKDIHIEIKFTEKTHKSFMQAQPKFSSLLGSRTDRKYYIFINEAYTIEGEKFDIEEIPSEVIVGWLGHELGHIMDYLDRGTFDMIWFGIKYLRFPNFVKEAERMADTYAVEHGLADYLIKTKDFILDHASLSEEYKSNIERFYLSPEEIMQLVEEKNEEDASN